MIELITRKGDYFEVDYKLELPLGLSQDLLAYLVKPSNMIGVGGTIYRTVGIDIFNRYIPTKKTFGVFYTSNIYNILSRIYDDSLSDAVKNNWYIRFFELSSLRAFIVPASYLKEFCSRNILRLDADTKLKAYKSNSAGRFFIVVDGRTFLINIAKKLPQDMLEYFRKVGEYNQIKVIGDVGYDESY